MVDHPRFLSRKFLSAGILWACLGTAAGLFNELHLFLQIPEPDTGFDFGIWRPVHTGLLLYGAGFSFLCGFTLHLLSVFDPQRRDYRLLRFAFPLLQSGVLLGVIGLLLGANTGRETIEFNTPAIWLILGALLITLFNVLHFQPDGKMPAPLFLITVSLSGGTLSLFLSNPGLPPFPLPTASFFSGWRDNAVQELFRLNYLVFFILFPVVALIRHLDWWLAGARPETGHTNRLFVLFVLMLLPMAIWSRDIFAPLSPFLRSIGIVAFGALFILPGWEAFPAFHSIRKYIRINPSGAGDRFIALFALSGILLFILWNLLRALFSFRLMQTHFNFTWLDIADPAFDLQTYVLMFYVGFSLLVCSKSGFGRSGRTLFSLFFFLAAIGIALMLWSNMHQGILMGLNFSEIDPAGKFLYPRWSEVLLAGPVFFRFDTIYRLAGDFSGAYISGFRGVHMLGNLLLFLAVLGLSIGILIRFRAIDRRKPNSGSGEVDDPTEG